MPGIVIAMMLIGTVLVNDSNRKLNEKCAQEVLDGVAESHQECRRYYMSKQYISLEGSDKKILAPLDILQSLV